MPAAGQVVTDFGAVLQVAGFVKMRIRIAAALNAEELQRVFENCIINGGVYMERCRCIFSDNEEVFACRRKRREVGSVQVFFLRADGILLAELIDTFQGVE